MIGQMVSLLGAAMILLAFAAQQMGKLDPKDLVYVALNLFGSAILTYFAVGAHNLGLIALEGAWAVISLASLPKALRRSASPQR